MPKSNPVPSYRRQKRKGKPDIAFVEIDGHRHYLGEYGSPESREAYGRLLAEYQSSGNRAPAQPDSMTVVELCARYLDHADAYYRRPDGQRTKSYEEVAYAVKPLRQLYGRTLVNDFTPANLKAVRHTMTQGKWARKTVNARVGIIRRMFKWAVAEGIADPMTHHALTALEDLRAGRTDAPEHDPVTPVPEAHVDATLEHVNRHVAAMIRTQRLTGMRPAEVAAMTTGAIDTSGNVWTYTPAHHKTQHHGHKRTIYIGPKAQAVLRPFLRADLSACIFNAREAYAEDRAAKSDATGKGKHRRPDQPENPRKSDRTMADRYDVNAYRRAIHRACDKAGIPRWSPNRLRHNFATELRREYGIEAAQTALGHRMGSSVTEVYAEQNHERARQIIGQVG